MRSPLQSLLGVGNIRALFGGVSRIQGVAQMVSENVEGPVTQFVLRPNQSMEWHQVKWFFGVVATVSVSIAVSFAMIGFWPILPFAGLELFGLAFALYICALGNRRCQVITVSQDEVLIEKGQHEPEEHWQLPTTWVRVSLDTVSSSWYPRRLRIWSHGKGVEIGEFLNEEERETLAGQLKQVLADVRAI